MGKIKGRLHFATTERKTILSQKAERSGKLRSVFSMNSGWASPMPDACFSFSALFRPRRARAQPSDEENAVFREIQRPFFSRSQQ
ncbi:MAG: hypothetical protein IJL00_07470 [Clostridia bacterium]|nr:hypothetical protein [Clostridia bacterium]